MCVQVQACVRCVYACACTRRWCMCVRVRVCVCAGRRSMYGISKVAEIAYTFMLARAEPGITVSAMCPGYCATNMSSHKGPRTAAKGAETATLLATAPLAALAAAAAPGPVTGRFWFNDRPLPTFEAEWAGPVETNHVARWD